MLLKEEATRVALLLALFILPVSAAFAQQPEAQPESKVKPTAHVYARELRGYKVERVKVEIKQSPDDRAGARPSPDVEALIQFGEPRIVSTTAKGLTLEVPVTLAAVKQEGQVHFLTFEDMVVNGMPVTVEDYEYRFNLPTQRPVRLAEPVRLHVTTANAMLMALGQGSKPTESWPVTGRVYVFGRFKKFWIGFKRVVPVELSLSLRNPLKKKM